jgi:hypothetical protein
MGLISNGTTIFDAGSMAAGFGGSMSFIKKLTASSSGDLTFHNGASNVIFDSTYKEYLFTFNNMHPATDKVDFQFQVNAAGGADFNETITSTYFRAYHNENDSATAFGYYGSGDLAQGTSFQMLSDDWGNGNDESLSGYLRFFNPSSTTFVKHFEGRISQQHGDEIAWTGHMAGYVNTTSAIDEIRFKADSGNIDAGDICLYGIS